MVSGVLRRHTSTKSRCVRLAGRESVNEYESSCCSRDVVICMQ